MATIAVVTTVASRDDALRIASALVERRLAACVQVSAIDSVYRWQGAVQHDAEQRLVIKTVASRYAAVEAALREMHPYELPQIVALAFDRVLPAYAQWVAGECDGG